MNWKRVAQGGFQFCDRTGRVPKLRLFYLIRIDHFR